MRLSCHREKMDRTKRRKAIYKWTGEKEIEKEIRKLSDRDFYMYVYPESKDIVIDGKAYRKIKIEEKEEV